MFICPETPLNLATKEPISNDMTTLIYQVLCDIRASVNKYLKVSATFTLSLHCDIKAANLQFTLLCF